MLASHTYGRTLYPPPESRESGKLRLSEIRLGPRCLHCDFISRYRNDNRAQRVITEARVIERIARMGWMLRDRRRGRGGGGVKREPSVVAARKLLLYIGLEIKRMPGVI